MPARLLGIALTSLNESDAEMQLSLLEEPSASAESDRDRALARTVDKVRAKFGRSAIGPGPVTVNRRGSR